MDRSLAIDIGPILDDRLKEKFLGVLCIHFRVCLCVCLCVIEQQSTPFDLGTLFFNVDFYA